MRLATALLALCACEGSSGTLQLELATAPGSTLLSSIERLELTLTNPAGTFEAVRGAEGLDLAFEIDAVETEGRIYIEGFDANAGLVAVGQSPPFPLAGTDGRVVIYVAPPYSILPAPVELLPARSFVGGTAVIYGAVLAGGLDASSIPSASMAIYNIYDHTIGYGEDMPVHRASPTLAANDTAGVYVLGGEDDLGAATSTLYRFQTNVAPRGVYADLGVHPGLESRDQRALKLGADLFFVTGPQPALITASTIAPIPNLANVPSTAATTTVDGNRVAAYLRDASIATYAIDGGSSELLLPTTAVERAIVSGAADKLIVVGGSTRDAISVSLATRVATVRPNVLSVPRRSPTVASTARHILVANGLDENGAVIGTADILDATTLALLATVPLEPRLAVALPMPNDQILIAGGGTPTALIELFTPPVPRDPARQ